MALIDGNLTVTGTISAGTWDLPEAGIVTAGDGLTITSGGVLNVSCDGTVYVNDDGELGVDGNGLLDAMTEQGVFNDDAFSNGVRLVGAVGVQAYVGAHSVAQGAFGVKPWNFSGTASYRAGDVIYERSYGKFFRCVNGYTQSGGSDPVIGVGTHWEQVTPAWGEPVKRSMFGRYRMVKCAGKTVNLRKDAALYEVDLSNETESTAVIKVDDSGLGLDANDKYKRGCLCELLVKLPETLPQGFNVEFDGVDGYVNFEEMPFLYGGETHRIQLYTRDAGIRWLASWISCE